MAGRERADWAQPSHPHVQRLTKLLIVPLYCCTAVPLQGFLHDGWWMGEVLSVEGGGGSGSGSSGGGVGGGSGYDIGVRFEPPPLGEGERPLPAIYRLAP